MSMANAMIQELEMEAATTRRVLERITDDQLQWTPDPKSRTVGQLAMHIAVNPANVSTMAAQNPADLPSFGEVTATSAAELLTTLDRSVATAKDVLSGLSDDALNDLWRARVNGTEVLAMPRNVFLRSVLLNHWYHHRGQLSVYLRLLGTPVPSIYGPSADENPFM